MITRAELSGIADVTTRLIKAYTDKFIAPLLARQDAIEKHIETIPSGKDGKDAPPIHEIVLNVLSRIPTEQYRAEDRQYIKESIAAEITQAIAMIPAPQNGKDGKDGKDFDPEAVRPLIRSFVAAEITRVVNEIPKPKDGKDGQSIIGPQGLPGKDAAPVDIEQIVERIIKQMPAPQLPETLIKALVDVRVAEAVSLLPKPKDGEPGRDALQLDILPAIDDKRSYPRGTIARYDGGLVRAFRDTQPLGIIGKPAADAGWEVILNGVSSADCVQLETPGRFNFTVKMTSGEVIERLFTLPIMDYVGVYKAGTTYTRGQWVTQQGSIWICLVESTMIAPATANNRDWQLAVRSGKDGKSFDAPKLVDVGSLKLK